MAMIYYKFKSQKEFKVMYIESALISVSNLRGRLFEEIKLRRGDGLLIFNSQSNEEYVDRDALIPKNTSVLLQRVPPAWPIDPITIQQKETNTVSTEPMTCSSTSTVEELNDLKWDDFGEDPFSSVIIDAQSTQLAKSKSDETYSRADIGHEKRRVGNELLVASHYRERYGIKRKAPPIGYICHRCNTPGHFIQHCHTNSNRDCDKKRLRRPTGIPKSLLKESSEGSYLLPNGATAVVQPDEATFLKEMAKLPSMIPNSSTVSFLSVSSTTQSGLGLLMIAGLQCIENFWRCCYWMRSRKNSL